MTTGYKGYSFLCKKMVPITKVIKTVKRKLPNGNTATIVVGQTKGCGIVSAILPKKAASKPKAKVAKRAVKPKPKAVKPKRK
jgi:hypothetical protein